MYWTVWEATMACGPGHRAGLHRAAVLDAAHTLVAEDGLDALTMRALARRLDVAPNALYSHVPGKTELVDALLDDRLALVERRAGRTRRTRSPRLGPDDLDLRECCWPGPTSCRATSRQGFARPTAVRLEVVLDALLARLGLPAGGRAPAAVR
jgi:AcrR family transcriptional regulator